MENSYVDYKPTRGKKGEEYYKAIQEGIDRFIKEPLYKTISDSESRVAGAHVEASYLCHGIWTKIMNNKFNQEKPQSGNSFYWCEEETKPPILFHFDIMNNPKEKSCGLAKDCSKKKRKEWGKIYHSIGNMTPIPWFEIDGNHYIDGQQLHKSLDERWDLYLRFLQFSWDNFVDSSIMRFEDYMILTCQQMYFKEIYNEIKKIDIEKITYETIDTWNKRINKDSELVSFSRLKVEKTVDIIVKLIKIRCKVIRLMLESEQTINKF